MFEFLVLVGLFFIIRLLFEGNVAQMEKKAVVNTHADTKPLEVKTEMLKISTKPLKSEMPTISSNEIEMVKIFTHNAVLLISRHGDLSRLQVLSDLSYLPIIRLAVSYQIKLRMSKNEFLEEETTMCIIQELKEKRTNASVLYTSGKLTTEEIRAIVDRKIAKEEYKNMDLANKRIFDKAIESKCLALKTKLIADKQKTRLILDKLKNAEEASKKRKEEEQKEKERIATKKHLVTFEGELQKLTVEEIAVKVREKFERDRANEKRDKRTSSIEITIEILNVIKSDDEDVFYGIAQHCFKLYEFGDFIFEEFTNHDNDILMSIDAYHDLVDGLARGDRNLSYALRQAKNYQNSLRNNDDLPF